MGKPAVDLLANLPRLGPFVITGRTQDEPLPARTLEDAWWRLCETAGIVDENGEASARLHDLRHTLGTYGGQEFNAFIVRDLLRHKTLAMTARYVERDTNPLRAAADQVSGRIAAAMSGRVRAEVSRSACRDNGIDR